MWHELQMSRSPSRQSFYVKKAKPEDEAVIRKLLRDAPMQGAVRLALLREPDANLAAAIEGDKHNTVLVMDAGSEQVLGMGNRSVRPLYVDGQVCSVGYLGLLRVSPGRKAFRRLVAGFRELEQTRSGNELDYDVTSIVEDNSVVVRLLERGLKGLPHYQALAKLSTFILATSTKVAKVRNKVETASIDDLGDIVSCLQEYLCQYQFSPYWDEQAIQDARLCNNLSPNDFLIIRDGNKVSSCLAIWDQRKFKQVIIRGYSGLISYIRPMLNMFLFILGKPTLPKAPGELNMAYISHLAVRNNDPGKFVDMVKAARDAAAKRGIDYLALGLTTVHPLHGIMHAAFPHYQYTSNLYTVHWDRKPADVLRGRIPHVEVAVL
jgi:hypothetical protein